MRRYIDAGLLLLIGSALLVACSDGKASSGGGTGGRSTAVATGGTPGVGSGGAAGSSTKPGSGGAGGTMAVATGGAPAGGAGGSAVAGTGGSAMDGAGGATTGPVEVEGGPCSVEGQRSACASAGLDPCMQCRGAWLSCYQGKWYHVHCDPIPEPPIEPGRDAAIDASDAADVPQVLDGGPLDTTSIDTGNIDGTGSALDSDGVLRGYLTFANEMMAFEACGTTTPVWANLQGWEGGKELLPDLGPYCTTTDAGPAPCPATIYVELVGTIVSGGTYGHMGKYTSQLTVGRYLAASRAAPAECPYLKLVFPN